MPVVTSQVAGLICQQDRRVRKALSVEVNDERVDTKTVSENSTTKQVNNPLVDEEKGEVDVMTGPCLLVRGTDTG